MIRTPSSERGKRTYQKVLKSATNLFREKGYQEVSIASICKEAKIGNSSFYQYFSTKDDVLKEIVGELLDLLEKNVERSINSSSNLEKRLHAFLNSFFSTIEKNVDEYAVFRNAEFLNPQVSKRFHSKMYSLLSESLFPNVEGEETKEVAYIFIIGAIRFIITSYEIYKKETLSLPIKESLFDLLYNGIDPDAHRISPLAFEVLKSEEKPSNLLSKGSLTHKKLLDAAEKMFGEKGYSKAKISDIANEAGLGLGTFYIHFNSKIEALRELVFRTLEGMKLNLRRYISRFEDRRDAEIAGYVGFCDFFKQHENMYAIVRETEFVDPKTAAFYYFSISDSYKRALEKAFRKNEYRKFDPEFLSFALMGVGHSIGQILLIQKNVEMNECVSRIRDISSLLMHGLRELMGR